MSRVVIGTGTGRCGTVSLAKILNGCHHMNITHERKSLMIAWGDASLEDVHDLCTGLTYPDHPYVGDVSHSHMRFLQLYLKSIDDIRIICLHRPKDEVVESWLRKQKGYSHCRKEDVQAITDNRHGFWNTLFPKFSKTKSSRHAWEVWWEYCEAKMRGLMDDRVHHMNTVDLNDDDKLDEMYDFLEVAKEHRHYPAMRVYNVSAEASPSKV